MLIVAGSDSGGGAGIQADIKTCVALGAYAATAVTAVTAQDTRGVHGVLPVPPAFVVAQMRAVLDDIGADAVKIGMLVTAATAAAVAGELRGRGLPVVLDPVMVAKGGARLLDDAAMAALLDMMTLATVVTPNAPEAEAMTGLAVRDPDAARAAAMALLRMGAPAVLMKGGHLPGPEVVDVLADAVGVTEWREARIETRHTHGTGCTLASAVAVGLARGVPLRDAVARARAFTRAAMRNAPGFGAGHGPLGHAADTAM